MFCVLGNCSHMFHVFLTCSHYHMICLCHVILPMLSHSLSFDLSVWPTFPSSLTPPPPRPVHPHSQHFIASEAHLLFRLQDTKILWRVWHSVMMGCMWHQLTWMVWSRCGSANRDRKSGLTSVAPTSLWVGFSTVCSVKYYLRVRLNPPSSCCVLLMQRQWEIIVAKSVSNWPCYVVH